MAEYSDITTAEGTLRIWYELTIGDLLIGSVLALVLFFLILDMIRKILWRS
jgi:hypothetical protein